MSAFPRRRAVAVALLATLCACVWFVPAAAAEFGPIQLVSKSAKEQAGFATEAALSADGRYVAFRGELGGHIGVFRKDLATGALTLVAEALSTNAIESAAEAEAPSISADGRYVSFTSNRPLDPVADPEPGTQDVYVADLGTFPAILELASAAEGARMSGSSTAAPRVALSADGGEVAFINDEEVYVRRLAESESLLISARRDPFTGAMTTEPVPGGGARGSSGAALSADGKAVAWVGYDLPDQVPVSPPEEVAMRAIEAQHSEGARYYEPLWREVPTALGPAPTLRIVGGDGQFPGLVDNHPAEAIRSFEGIGWGLAAPQLSADGRVIATIGSPDGDPDLFVAEMDPGTGRFAPAEQLTKWVNPTPGETSNGQKIFEDRQDLVSTGPIKQCAISPDGTRIAFTTVRQSFPLSPPALTTPRPVVLPIATELYQVDLGGMTIERVTPGPGTSVSTVPGSDVIEPSLPQDRAAARYGEGGIGAGGPSYSADGRTLAFASGGFNLVPGDGNEASDVFTVETPPPTAVQPSTISRRPSSISVPIPWRLTVHAVSRPNGAVRIVAGVPGAGTLRAAAQSRFGSKPRPRQVKAAQRHTGGAGLLRLELALPAKLRSLARRKGGLYTTLDIQFSGPGGRPLIQVLVARFRAHRPAPKKKGKG